MTKRKDAAAIVDSLCELIDAREAHRKYGKAPRGVLRARKKAIEAMAKKGRAR